MGVVIASHEVPWWTIYASVSIVMIDMAIHLKRHPLRDPDAFPPGYVFQRKSGVKPSDPAALGVNGAETSAFLNGLSCLGKEDWEHVARSWPTGKWRRLLRRPRARDSIFTLISRAQPGLDLQPLITEVHRLSVAKVIPGMELLVGHAAVTDAALALYAAPELAAADVERLYAPFQAVLPRESLLAG